MRTRQHTLATFSPSFGDCQTSADRNGIIPAGAELSGSGLRLGRIALTRRAVEFAAAQFELASPSLRDPNGIDFGRRSSPLRGCNLCSLFRDARLELKFSSRSVLVGVLPARP